MMELLFTSSCNCLRNSHATALSAHVPEFEELKKLDIFTSCYDVR